MVYCADVPGLTVTLGGVAARLKSGATMTWVNPDEAPAKLASPLYCAVML